MNLRDGNPAEARRAMEEAKRRYEETLANWETVRRLEAESVGHFRENHFAARMKRAYRGEVTP